jgi:hypothetical protein
VNTSRPQSITERAERAFERLFDPVGRWILTSRLMNYIHLVPSLPGVFRKRFAHPDSPWKLDLPPLAPHLASAPGIRRNPVAEQAAFEAAPLQVWTQIHYAASRFALKQVWRSVLPVAPQAGCFPRLPPTPPGTSCAVTSAGCPSTVSSRARQARAAGPAAARR